jgi:hypothetical protein
VFADERDFFDFAVRYQPLATPTVRLEWRAQGHTAIRHFRENRRIQAMAISSTTRAASWP